MARELQQLIAERTEYCTVDTAYEAVDPMEASGDSELMDCWWETIKISYDGSYTSLSSYLYRHVSLQPNREIVLQTRWMSWTPI